MPIVLVNTTPVLCHREESLLALTLTMPTKEGHGAHRNGQKTVAVFGLRFHELKHRPAVIPSNALERSLNEGGRLFSIDVLPFQSQDLAEAQASCKSRANSGRESPSEPRGQFGGR